MTYQPTDHEIEVIAAWWWAGGSNVRPAFLLGRAEQTIKNTLYQLRKVHAADTNVELVHRYFRQVQKHRKSMQQKAVA